MKQISSRLFGVAFAAVLVAGGCGGQSQSTANTAPTKAQLTQELNSIDERIKKAQNDPKLSEQQKQATVGALQAQRDGIQAQISSAPSGG